MEYLDIINENDQIIGQASKKDIYNKMLRHRIVHVLIFNNKNEMLLQQRNKKL